MDQKSRTVQVQPVHFGATRRATIRIKQWLIYQPQAHTLAYAWDLARTVSRAQKLNQSNQFGPDRPGLKN